MRRSDNSEKLRSHMNYVVVEGMHIYVTPVIMDELGLRQGQRVDLPVFYTIIAKQHAAMVVDLAIQKAQEATRS